MKKNNYNRRATIPDESKMIGRILGGHTEEFGVLVNRYAESVVRVVRRIVPSAEDAEDVAQDTFVAAFQDLKRFDSARASFKNWLLGIASHMALKRIQGSAAFSFVSIDQEQWGDMADAEVDEWLNDTSTHRLAQLDKAVKRLAPNDQLLLSFYYYDDLRLKEIAAIMNCTDSYLRSRLQWIRKKLCQTIKSLEEYEDQ